ncbi:helix-turn-helix transcriptional regulator [Streptomyces diastaticus]
MSDSHPQSVAGVRQPRAPGAGACGGGARRTGRAGSFRGPSRVRHATLAPRSPHPVSKPVRALPFSVPRRVRAGAGEPSEGSRVVRARHRRWRGEVRRELCPLGIVLKGGLWYLVAASGERADGPVRTYRIARPAEAEVTGTRFARPEGYGSAAYWARSAERLAAAVRRKTAVVRLSPRAVELLPMLLGAAGARPSRVPGAGRGGGADGGGAGRAVPGVRPPGGRAGARPAGVREGLRGAVGREGAPPTPRRSWARPSRPPTPGPAARPASGRTRWPRGPS